jgi:hypothetical protein
MYQYISPKQLCTPIDSCICIPQNTRTVSRGLPHLEPLLRAVPTQTTHPRRTAPLSSRSYPPRNPNATFSISTPFSPFLLIYYPITNVIDVRTSFAVRDLASSVQLATLDATARGSCSAKGIKSDAQLRAVLWKTNAGVRTFLPCMV